MELNFDKEIDALLRRMAQTERSSVQANELPTAHLDADEISAFAENALPEKARARCTAHLADCDPCRMTLSNLISLNSLDETIAAPVTETVAAVVPKPEIPWYRRLLATPNLAYVMGGLVVVFAGIAALTVWQTAGGLPETAQLDKSENSALAPADKSSAANSDAPAAAANRVAANVANSAVEPPATSGEPADETRDADKSSSPGGPRVSTEESKNESRREDTSDLKTSQPAKPAPDEKTADLTTLSKEDNKPADGVVAVGEAAPATKSAPAPGGRIPEPAAKKRDKLTVRSADEEVADKDDADTRRKQTERQISGKTFRRADGVWYDTDYDNQPTINVRRNTAQYRNLDTGLRSIAEKLDGTIVVVWNRKAYRIN